MKRVFGFELQRLIQQFISLENDFLETQHIKPFQG